MEFYCHHGSDKKSLISVELSISHHTTVAVNVVNDISIPEMRHTSFHLSIKKKKQYTHTTILDIKQM